jgi:hypothetical protein
MKLRHSFLLMLLLLLMSPQAFAGQEIGGISDVVGGVDVLRGGKLPAETAKVGDKVSQGDIIRTKSGAKAQIKFKDDSVITIAPDSRVALNEYVYEPEKNQREASIKIFHGLVHTAVNKLFNKKKPDFTVETLTASLGIRGTDFYTLVAPALSDIYNNSGNTEVRNVSSEIPGSVKLQGREYTRVSRNLPPTLPLPLTADDIKWLQQQMTPRVVAHPSGSGAVSGQTELLVTISGHAVKTQSRRITDETLLSLGLLNPIQDLQSSLYVPPQSVPVVTAPKSPESPAATTMIPTNPISNTAPTTAAATTAPITTTTVVAQPTTTTTTSPTITITTTIPTTTTQTPPTTVVTPSTGAPNGVQSATTTTGTR